MQLCPPLLIYYIISLKTRNNLNFSQSHDQVLQRKAERIASRPQIIYTVTSPARSPGYLAKTKTSEYLSTFPHTFANNQPNF